MERQVGEKSQEETREAGRKDRKYMEQFGWEESRRKKDGPGSVYCIFSYSFFCCSVTSCI